MSEKQKNDFPVIYHKLKNLTITKNNSDINILLLGETGVGKSTFINAFFNYIKFPTLARARSEQLQVVIPTKFTITDENYQERLIKVGKDHNECIEIGASATQSCRSYVYLVPGTNLKIRMIDTPGVGDTRGIDQDNVNLENVLAFIGELKHLNAICILLKPNNSRVTVMFEFCIKQLLSRLEKSASKNLLFVFTNTRSTFYRPGETLPSLKKLLSTIPGISIPCAIDNIFCTDNESFRFLAALKNRVKFSGTDVRNFSQSWTHSYKEILRMLMYIIGEENKPGLSPHDVKNTISVNEARRVIIQLAQPLADIAQLIQENIRAIDSHQERLKCNTTSLSELKKKLYIPIIDLKVTKLDQPTTVCTSQGCSDVYQVGDKKKWHYRQKCHFPCYLRNVPKEVIGSPELINCAAMSNGECKLCSCRYQVHMHIYYETKTYEAKLEDSIIKSEITSKEEALRSAQNLTLRMSNRVRQLREEQDTIIKVTAKFACFLKTNAITPYNDAYESYLKYLIDRERSMNEATDHQLIKQMEKMLREYVEEKIAIMNAIDQAHDSNSIISTIDVFKGIRSLHSLEINGPKIKEMFEAQNRARKDENESKTKEYVFSPGSNKTRQNFKPPQRGRGRTINPPNPNQTIAYEHNIRVNVYPEPGPSYPPPLMSHYHQRFHSQYHMHHPTQYGPPPPYTPTNNEFQPSRNFAPGRNQHSSRRGAPNYRNERQFTRRNRQSSDRIHNLNPSNDSSTSEDDDYFTSYRHE